MNAIVQPWFIPQYSETGLPASRTFWRRYAGTSPVGSFTANQFVLYDLAGNVWQCCEDWYSGGQKSRAVRDASWRNYNPVGLLSSQRSYNTPDFSQQPHRFSVCVGVK